VVLLLPMLLSQDLPDTNPSGETAQGVGQGACFAVLEARAGCSESGHHYCQYVAQKHVLHPCAPHRVKCTLHLVARNLVDSSEGSTDPKPV